MLEAYDTIDMLGIWDHNAGIYLCPDTRLHDLEVQGSHNQARIVAITQL